MIIIDHHADQELAETLEAIRQNGHDARAIFFSLRDANRPITEMQQAVVAAVKTHLASHNPRVYLCEDGDVFILSPVLPGKEGRHILLAMAEYMARPVSEEWAIFVDLPLHINKLLAAVEPKLEARRKSAEDKKREAERQQAERKRQMILKNDDVIERDTIAARRRKRDHAEFMIIEDDVFSQRLVSNVLEKQYPMTGLKEATGALDTYARVAPDLLFLDINLPDVSGHELLERIMEMDPDAYVIMLSGNADKENITQALSKGARGFVAKPFNRERLLQYVDRCPTIQH